MARPYEVTETDQGTHITLYRALVVDANNRVVCGECYGRGTACYMAVLPGGFTAFGGAPVYEKCRRCKGVPVYVHDIDMRHRN